jgi:16S rRNA (cytosine967-C5)-methyltransferase
VYQLAFLTRIPRSAAVNEGTSLARKHLNPQAARYVNAVLRKVSEAVGQGGLPQPDGDREGRLSVLYSHPPWLVKRFCDVLGADALEALLAANNRPDLPMSAQVNTLRVDADGVLAKSRQDGVDATIRRLSVGLGANTEPENGDVSNMGRVEPPRTANGEVSGIEFVELRRVGDLRRLSAYKRGHIYIQDAAARLAVMAADPKPGDYLIDGCAAPGGKSFAAAIAMRNKGHIEALDSDADKLRLVKEGADRMGLSIISATECDASTPVEALLGKADVVIADVPCSGFGAIRKKPEIRYKPPQDIEGLPGLQKRILSNLSAYVKPGGTLLYSTCTVMREENEDVVEWFLAEHGQFRLEAIDIPEASLKAESGMLTLWPHLHDTDGFFICKMKREPT